MFSLHTWLFKVKYSCMQNDKKLTCDNSLRLRDLFFYSFRFKLCSCSYDGHLKFTWSLTSGPVGLVEVHVSWPEHQH